jgi:hypothetical protein
MTMAFFEWTQSANDTLSADGYRIDRIREGRTIWLLHFDDRLRVPAGFRPGAVDWKYRSLTSAKAAAVHVEMQRRRRVKIMRHAFWGVVFSVAAVVVFATLGEMDRSARLVWFAVGMICTGLALREMTHGIIMFSSGSWDYLYEAPRVTVVDSFIARFLVRLVPNPRDPEPDRDGKVRIVPIE